MEHAELFDRTATPCPPWCTAGVGHGFAFGTDLAQGRVHVREVGEVAVDEEPAVWVDVQAEESLTVGADGVDVHVDAPTVHVFAEGVDLTGPMCRELAAMLLEAADLWDEVTRS